MGKIGFSATIRVTRSVAINRQHRARGKPQ
jgi:hypothetical protein